MNLDFINKITDNIKNADFFNSFKKEVEEKVNENLNKEEIVELNFIDKLKQDVKISKVSMIQLKDERSRILKEYNEKTLEDGDLYFVTAKKKSGDGYTVFFYKETEELVDSIENLPSGASIDSVLRLKNGQYVYDEIASNEIRNELNLMAENVIEKQNKELEDFRKENHIYIVEEDRKGIIYLTDTESEDGLVLEEVDFPENLKEKAVEGAKFKFIDGKYTEICE